MYAYVMRPETLPKSYHKFIVRQGPIHETVLNAVEDSCRGSKVDTVRLMNYVKDKGGERAVAAVRPYLEKPVVDMIPVEALHPHTSSSILATFQSFVGTAQRILPVYLSLTLVPAVVLRTNTVLKDPAGVLAKSIFSAARSTAFLATFCSSYMAQACLQRHIFQRMKWKDNKITYWVAGLFSSLAVLMEKKNRRSELALYCFPRAADSIFLILNDHRLMFTIPYGQLVLFCSSMSAIMFFYENHVKTVSPLVAKLLNRFLEHDIQISSGIEKDAQDKKMIKLNEE